MSLINDALKRAKEAQEQAPQPATPGPQLRPVEPGASPGHRSLLLPLTIALLGMAVVALGWQVFRGRTTGTANPLGGPELVAQAKTPVAPVSVTPTPAPTTTPPFQPGPPQPTALEVSTTVEDPAPAPPEVVEATEDPSEAVPAAPTEPAPLRLQGIVSHPTRPSALINGKTLFVGDRFRDFQLKVIRNSSVTLSGPAGTIVLTLH